MTDFQRDKDKEGVTYVQAGRLHESEMTSQIMVAVDKQEN